MQDNYRENSEEYKEVAIFLQRMQNQGAKLYFDDKIVDSMEAARRLVKEEQQYMADYILGEKGNVEQVRFDRVNAW